MTVARMRPIVSRLGTPFPGTGREITHTKRSSTYSSTRPPPPRGSEAPDRLARSSGRRRPGRRARRTGPRGCGTQRRQAALGRQPERQVGVNQQLAWVRLTVDAGLAPRPPASGRSRSGSPGCAPSSSSSASRAASRSRTGRGRPAARWPGHRRRSPACPARSSSAGRYRVEGRHAVVVHEAKARGDHARPDADRVGEGDRRALLVERRDVGRAGRLGRRARPAGARPRTRARTSRRTRGCAVARTAAARMLDRS